MAFEEGNSDRTIDLFVAPPRNHRARSRRIPCGKPVVPSFHRPSPTRPLSRREINNLFFPVSDRTGASRAANSRSRALSTSSFRGESHCCSRFQWSLSNRPHGSRIYHRAIVAPRHCYTNAAGVHCFMGPRAMQRNGGAAKGACKYLPPPPRAL